MFMIIYRLQKQGKTKMHKRKQFHYAVIGVLGFALLFMAVGFAAYAQLINNDNASALGRSDAIHNVGFDANSYQESDNSIAPAEKVITSDELEVELRLTHPGDSYAAMINIVNTGNVPEVLSQIKMNELDQSIADHIDFHISFEDEDYIGTSYNVNAYIGRGQVGRRQMFIAATYKEDSQDIGPLSFKISTGLVFEK